MRCSTTILLLSLLTSSRTAAVGNTSPASQAKVAEAPDRRALVPIGRKRALVLANGAYSRRPLPFAQDGAKQFAAALRSVGFDVTEPAPDQDLAAMQASLHAFASDTQAGDVSLIYYAGHGAQVNQTNYLIPIGGENIQNVHDIPQKSISVDQFVTALAAGRTNVLILDACRNNPFPNGAIGPNDFVPGLAKPAPAQAGTFFAYATGPGYVASDGDSDVTLYTKIITRLAQRPGMKLDQLFRAVYDAIYWRHQTPWVSAAIGEADNIGFRPSAAVKMRFSEVDDDAMLLVNDKVVVHALEQKGKDVSVELLGGRNTFTVLIYNQATRTGGFSLFGGDEAEGWYYEGTLSGVKDGALALRACERRPAKFGSRHGKLFTVARGVLEVNELTGDVTAPKSELYVDSFDDYDRCRSASSEAAVSVTGAGQCLTSAAARASLRKVRQLPDVKLTLPVRLNFPASADIDGIVAELWCRAQQPVFLSSGIWLLLSPQGLVKHSPKAGGNPPVIDLLANPSIQLGPRPDPDARPMTFVAQASTPTSGRLEALVNYSLFEQGMLTRMQGQTVRIPLIGDGHLREVRLGYAEGGRLRVRLGVDFDRRVHFTVVGRLRLTESHHELSLEPESATNDELGLDVPWLMEEFRHNHWNLDTDLDESRKKLEEGLAAILGNNAKVKLTVVEPLKVDPKPEGIRVDARIDGSAEVWSAKDAVAARP